MTLESVPTPHIDWRTVQSRITVFHPEEASSDTLRGWWENAFKGVPLSRDETRHLEGIRSLGGVVDKALWTANAGTGRTDFLLQPPDSDMPPQSDPVWGQPMFAEPYHEVARAMVNPIRGYLEKSGRVDRLAFGMTLVAPAGPDLGAVIATLANALPRLKLDGLETPDFIFRVNRRTKSQHSPALVVNRLSTWSIAQGQIVTSSLGPQPSHSFSNQYAASVNVDINTVPVAATSRGIPPGRSTGVLDELVTFGLEIMEKGDVP